MVNPVQWMMRQMKNKKNKGSDSEGKKENKFGPRNSALIKTLKGVPLLNSCSKDELREMASALCERLYKPKEDVMTQGEFGDEFFIIAEGNAEVLVEDKGDVKKITELTKNDYFGEQALMNNTKRSATIRAVSALNVLVLSRSVFQKLNDSRDVMFVKRRAVCTNRVATKGALKDRKALDEKSQAFIKEHIKTNLLFASMEDETMNSVVQYFFKRTLKKGETIIEQGDGDATEFYVISSGEVDVLVKQKKVVSLDAGKCFGELALMYHAPRNATIKVSSEECEIYVLERVAYQFISEETRHESDEKLFGFLRGVKLLQPLLANELALVEQALVESIHKPKSVLFKQGDAPDHFYIIKDGSCDGVKIEKDGTEEIFHLTQGQFFGELALLHDEPRKATITAGDDGCKVLYLSKQDFSELLGPLQEILLRNEAEYKKPKNERDHFFDPMICDLEELKTIGLLGRGAFGKVTLVVDPKSEKSYALKAIKKRQITELGQSSHIVNEKNVMMMMNNRFLVNLRRTYRDQWRVYFLLDACLGGELFTLLRQKRSFTEAETRFYAACVVEAFSYMHNMDIVYRDLKPENLVMDTNGYLKVTDFGFAKIVQKKTYTLCGTPDYLAPEIVTGQGHGKAVDWWCLGVLIYELQSSFPPFFDDEPMGTYKKIIQGKFKFPKYFTPETRDLIARLLRTRPTKRLPILKGGPNNIRKHKWYASAGFKWDSLKAGTMKPPYFPKVKGSADISNFDQKDNRDSLPMKGKPPKTSWDKDF